MPEAVEVGPGKAAVEDLLVHDLDHDSPLYVRMLALMGPQTGLPMPVGVLRQFHRPTYESQVNAQIEAARKKSGTGSWQELLHGDATWTVE
jgi:hypothetical protein